MDIQKINRSRGLSQRDYNNLVDAAKQSANINSIGIDVNTACGSTAIIGADYPELGCPAFVIDFAKDNSNNPIKDGNYGYLYQWVEAERYWDNINNIPAWRQKTVAPRGSVSLGSGNYLHLLCQANGDLLDINSSQVVWVYPGFLKYQGGTNTPNWEHITFDCRTEYLDATLNCGISSPSYVIGTTNFSVVVNNLPSPAPNGVVGTNSFKIINGCDGGTNNAIQINTPGVYMILAKLSLFDYGRTTPLGTAAGFGGGSIYVPFLTAAKFEIYQSVNNAVPANSFVVSQGLYGYADNQALFGNITIITITTISQDDITNNSNQLLFKVTSLGDTQPTHFKSNDGEIVITKLDWNDGITGTQP